MTDKAKQGEAKTKEKNKIPPGYFLGSLIASYASPQIKYPPCVFCPPCASPYFYSFYPCSMRFGEND